MEIIEVLWTFSNLDFKESVIKRHRRHLLQLKDYMKSKGQDLYDESVGEEYQLEMLMEGNIKDSMLKEISVALKRRGGITNFWASSFGDRSVLLH